MKRNEVERHAPEARTDTNLPMDEAALDWLHDNHAHDLVGDWPSVIAQARAALTLRARVAELEKENTTIRALLVKYECPYGEKSLGECSRGFPGCACADDMLATASWCPEDEDKAAVRLGRRVAELEANNEGSLKAATYWKEQHDRAAKRVTELEAELASIKRQCIIRRGHEREDLMAHGETVLCSTELVARLYDDRIEAEARANALRDALEKADAAFNAWGRDEDGIHPDAWPAVEHLRATLKAHPAADLAAYRKSVLEEAAAAAESYLWNLPAIQSQVGANCGDAIRALAAQEVKP